MTIKELKERNRKTFGNRSITDQIATEAPTPLSGPTQVTEIQFGTDLASLFPQLK